MLFCQPAAVLFLAFLDSQNCLVAVRRSQSAPHMHVLVCICSNVRQFFHHWPEPPLWGNVCLARARCALGARPARYLSINYPDFIPRFTL